MRVNSHEIMKYTANTSVALESAKNDFDTGTPDFGVSFPFMIGPIPCDATFGASLSMGFGLTYGPAPQSVARVEPHGNASAYGIVRATVYIASAGISSNVNIVDLRMPISANSVVRLADDAEPNLDLKLDREDLRALDGRRSYLEIDAIIKNLECS